MLPDGYENAPPNILKAFMDGMKHGKHEAMANNYDKSERSREYAANKVFEMMMAGLSEVTQTISIEYIEAIRPQLPISKWWRKHESDGGE